MKISEKIKNFEDSSDDENSKRKVLYSFEYFPPKTDTGKFPSDPHQELRICMKGLIE
jgi:5,10-methylenetetrahydrofolate reductase